MSRKQIKKPRLALFVLTVVFLLALIQLFCSHQLATSGEQVALYEQEAAELAEANRQLETTINQMGSLIKIAAQAHSLDLVKTTQVLHLTAPAPVALGR